MSPVDSYRKNILGRENNDSIWEWVIMCQEQQRNSILQHGEGGRRGLDMSRGRRVQTASVL